MSTEDRLARLGLAHLADRPEELARALDERVARNQADAAAWADEVQRTPVIVVRARHAEGGRGRFAMFLALEGRDFAIGRTPPASMILDDPRVARRAVILRREGDAVIASDEDSASSVTCNRERLGTRAITPADELAVGPFRLDVDLVPRTAGLMYRALHALAADPPDTAAKRLQLYASALELALASPLGFELHTLEASEQILAELDGPIPAELAERLRAATSALIARGAVIFRHHDAHHRLEAVRERLG